MRFLSIVGLVLICSSCALVVDGGRKAVKTIRGASIAVVGGGEEVVKTIWGSSTRVLEKERIHGISKTYDKPYQDCMRDGLAVARKEKWIVFKKDEIKGYMVLIGIKGAVNTTEVGVFFDRLSQLKTRIDISSLSSNAKRMVAKALFHGLDIAFGFLPPDPPQPKEKDNKDTNQTQPQIL